MSTNDRWGDDTGRRFDDSSDGGSNWTLILGLGFLLLILLAGAGLMFVRMQRAQAVAVELAMVARAEAEQQRAQVALNLVETRDKLRDAYFPNQTEAVELGKAIVTYVNQPDDVRKPEEFIGKNIVLSGIGPSIGGGEMDMQITDIVQLKVKTDLDKVKKAATPTWSAFVLGKVIEIDRAAKVITVEALPENWKIDANK